jgi:hypothetical protein
MSASSIQFTFLLFPSPRVQHHSLLYRHRDTIRRRAGLPDIRLHDLRHSFASIPVNSGESFYLVQDLLGHSSPRMTQRYAHVAPDTRRRAVDVVDRLVQEASAGLEREGEPPPATTFYTSSIRIGTRFAALSRRDSPTNRSEDCGNRSSNTGANPPNEAED